MKKYLFIISTTVLLTLTACSGMKKTFGSSSYNQSYNETLTAFSTQKNVTLLGKKHTYTFSNAKILGDLLEAQKLLQLNPSNFSLNMSVKEYKSSDISLRSFSHFEKSKLSSNQISWLKAHNYALELRANLDGAKKSDPKPKAVPTYVKLITLKGKRAVKKMMSSANPLNPMITLEVSEHINR